MEDNLADAGLVREALNEHAVDCDLMLIADGDSAIRYIQSIEASEVACPDLIIMDLNLPKRSGRDVLRMARQGTKCHRATVLILSSSDAPEDKADSMRLGADRYICKPLRLEGYLQLGATLKEILEATVR